MRTRFALVLLVGCAGGSHTPPQLDLHGASSGEISGDLDPAKLHVTWGGSPVTAVELGQVVLGESRAAILQIDNLGGPTPIALAVQGDVFAIAETCSALRQGESCEISIVFAPLVDGHADGTLTITSTAGEIVIPLGGTGGVALSDPTPGLTITFVGDGLGEVEVRDEDTSQVLAICVASCAVSVDPGTKLEIRASAPSGFGGLAGACTTTEPGCRITADGPQALTATFNHEGEWTLLPGGGPVISAAYDLSNALVVAQSDRLTKLSPTGTVVWSLPICVDVVATGPDDTIYIRGAKLDANGALLWGTTFTGCNGGTSGEPFERPIAVAADGSTAVHSGTRVFRYTSDGVLAWSTEIITDGANGVMIDAAGNVHAQAMNVDCTDDVVLAAADGSELDRHRVSNGYRGMFASTPDRQLVVTSSGHGHAYLDGPGIALDRDTGAPASVPNGVAVTGTGQIIWIVYGDDSGGRPVSWLWRRPLTTPFGDTYGTEPLDVAGSPDGHYAVVGTYHGLAYRGAWIETFAPPGS